LFSQLSAFHDEINNVKGEKNGKHEQMEATWETK